MFYNVTLYRKVLFWLNMKTKTKIHKKSIQDQAEQTEKSSRLCQLQYRMQAQVSL